MLVPPRLGGLVRRCPNHPETLAVGLCNDCSGSYCDRCLYILKVRDGELYVCSNCLKKRRTKSAMGALGSGILSLIFGIALTQVLGPDVEVTRGYGIFIILCSLLVIVYGVYAWTTPWKKPTVHMRIAKIEAEKGKLPPTAQKFYSKMLNAYIGAFGSEPGKTKLEKRIEAYMEKGFERGEAILKVAQDEGYIE